MPASVPTTCPLCQSTRPRLMFHKDGIPYSRCPACHFHFSRPATNANFAERIEDFEAAYLQYLQADPADEVNHRATCKWMSRFSPLAGRVLDVGCGSGKFVRYLRRRGVDARGVEASRVLYDRFLAKEPHFFQGEVSDFCQTNPGQFETITTFDVLEHVANPVEFLQSLVSLVAPGGVLFISTTDVGSTVARVLGSRWHFYCKYHLSLFCRDTLCRVLEPMGMELIDFTHRGRLRAVGYAVRYAFEFLLRRRAPVWCRWLDGWYVPINIGDTMFAAFRKSEGA